MIIKRLSILITMMAASDARCTYDLDLPWPLHSALVRISREATPDEWPWSYETGPVDHAGIGVPALDGAVLEAYGEGGLEPEASRPRRLVVTPQGAVLARRRMMTVGPDVVATIYRAALIWATSASTLSKNLDTALWSGAATSSTSPPKRLQPLPVS